MRSRTKAQGLVRPMLDCDLACVLAWRNHPDVRRNMYSQQEISMSEHQDWFARASQDKNRHLLIFEMSQRPLGFVNLHEVAAGRIADWGFYTAPDAAKGTGRCLGEAALQHAFDQLDFHKIVGQVLAYNARSIKFHLSLGFQKEGSLREQHFDGASYHNVVCFGLLRHEWNAAHQL